MRKRRLVLLATMALGGAVAVSAQNSTTNIPPTVSIVSPTNESRFEAPADIFIMANAIDRDGQVFEVSFFANQHYIGGVTNPPPDLSPLPPWRMTWQDVPAGIYSLQARATDDRGARGWSMAIRIEVRGSNAPPGLPVVNVRASDPEASEGGTRSWGHNGAFLFSRDGSTANPLTVYFDISGTADNGVDYERIPESATFAAGQGSTYVYVRPIDDNEVEPTETVVVKLEDPVCATVVPPPPGCYRVGPSNTATVYIRDGVMESNSPPVVRLISPTNESSFPEGATIRVCADAFDHTRYLDTVEFFANDRSLGIVTNNPYSLGPNGLAPYQPFCVVWSNAPAGDHILTAKATDNFGLMATSAPVPITVGGPPPPPELPVVNVQADDPEAEEPGTRSWGDSGSFLFSRSGSTANPLTAYFKISGTAANGVDYQRIGESVSFAAGNSLAYVTVWPLEDNEMEPTESVVVTLEDPACAAIVPPPPGCYRVGPGNTATVFIRDGVIESNSPPVVQIISPTNESKFPEGASIRVCADAFDDSRFLDTVEFFANERSLGIVTNYLRHPDIYASAPFTWPCVVWSNAPAGDHVLTAKATDNFGLMATSAPVRITVGPPPPPQTVVTIEAVDPIATEQDPRLDVVSDPALLVVHRHGPTNIALTVLYRVGGSASNGVDYEKLSGEVSIPAGARTGEIYIEAIDDALVEGTESVIITLMPPPCIAIYPPPPECYNVGQPDSATAYIRDNDSAPSNARPIVRITAPTNNAAFPAGSDITIEAVTVDEDGYAPMAEFFANGMKIGEQVIHFIQAPPDGTPIEFSFVWSNVVANSAGSYSLTVRATDDEGATRFSDPVRIFVGTNQPPPTTNNFVTIETVDGISSETDPRTDALPDNALLRVRRHGPTNINLTVFYRTGGNASNGVDYARLSGEVIIPAGSRAADIEIQPMDDLLVEGTETVIITLIEPACIAIYPPPPECYRVGQPGSATAYIRDNDFSSSNSPPTVRITSPANGANFPAGSDIRIDAVTVDRDGYAPMVEFFANGHKIGEQVIHFIQPPPNGTPIEFSFVWSNVVAGSYTLTAKATDDDGAMALSTPVGIRVGTNEPARPPTNVVVSIVALDSYASEGPWTNWWTWRSDGSRDTNSVGTRGTNTAVFAVRRAGPTNDPVTVRYHIGGTASNGVDYVALSGAVTIPAGARAATIVVAPLEDGLVEGTETVVLELAQPAEGEPPAYTIGLLRRAGAIITDNDGPPTRCRRLPGELFYICLPGTNGHSYRLEASSDLVNWVALCSSVVTDGAIYFVDVDAHALPYRFYRAVTDSTAE